jgi:hypothetical protein
LWVDVMEIVWVTLLSRVANKDAADGKEEVAVVGGDGFGVDPALEIELAEQTAMTGDDPLAKSWPAVRSAPEDETSPILREALSVIRAFSPANLPPPSQLAANVWPLLALWPLLFAFYQAELALGLNV